MAGETPGASKHSKRRKLAWNEDKSTNKIYASDQVSALGKNQTVSDSVLKPGQKAKGGIPTPIQKPDDKSADKYYANGGSARQRGAVAGEKKVAPASPPKATPKPASLVPMTIRDKAQIAPIIEDVVGSLKAGGTNLVVYIAKGNSELLRRTRAALELQVTREKITEDEYREVRLSYEIDGTEPVVAPPTPPKTVAIEAPPVADPLAFLNGTEEETEDPVVDTTPTKVEVVDKVIEPVTAPTTDDDEGDNDFLKPTPVVFEAPAVAHTPPEPGEETIVLNKEQSAAFKELLNEEPVEEKTAVEENLPKRRGKRSGRGSD